MKKPIILMAYLTQKKKLKNRLFLFFCFFLFPCSIYTKDRTGHSMDMLQVLGLEPSPVSLIGNLNQNPLQNMFNAVSDRIDNYTDFYTKLKINYPFFTYGKYGHRLIFHWGFDLDKDGTERQYPAALKRQFDECLKRVVGEDLTNKIKSEEWKAFLNTLMKKQQEQAQALTVEIEKCLGLHASDARDVAAILYYTHLLGDHIEHNGAHTGKSVLEINKIKKNLSMHISSLAKTCRSFYYDYESTIRKIQDPHEGRRAQAILDALKIYIPKILKFQYSKQFTSKGLIFSPEKNLLKAS